MLGSWFVQDGVLVSTQGQSPSLKVSRCHNWNGSVFSKDVLEWFVI